MDVRQKGKRVSPESAYGRGENCSFSLFPDRGPNDNHTDIAPSTVRPHTFRRVYVKAVC